MNDLETLLQEVRACRVCASELPLGPRPILRAQTSSRLLIIGQAPGTKVHESGVPWQDASGERLREWLGISVEQFYDESVVAIIPMGFCYPGRDAKGGDLPPRPECAPLWHPRLLSHLLDIELTLLIGGYAQKRALGAQAKNTVTATVENWRDYLPNYFALPHPSWRTLHWEKKNPWFTGELLPALRDRVAQILK
jgi:uracil-DNA glycosylase